MTKSEIQQDIINILKENYKSSTCNYANLSEEGDYVVILDKGLSYRNYPYAAKRILDKHDKIRVVHFIGGWNDYVYTRNTLKWGGYYD